jgi:hypothetical protein
MRSLSVISGDQVCVGLSDETFEAMIKDDSGHWANSVPRDLPMSARSDHTASPRDGAQQLETEMSEYYIKRFYMPNEEAVFSPQRVGANITPFRGDDSYLTCFPKSALECAQVMQHTEAYRLMPTDHGPTWSPRSITPLGDIPVIDANDGHVYTVRASQTWVGRDHFMKFCRVDAAEGRTSNTHNRRGLDADCHSV